MAGLFCPCQVLVSGCKYSITGRVRGGALFLLKHFDILSSSVPQHLCETGRLGIQASLTPPFSRNRPRDAGKVVISSSLCTGRCLWLRTPLLPGVSFPSTSPFHLWAESPLLVLRTSALRHPPLASLLLPVPDLTLVLDLPCYLTCPASSPAGLHCASCLVQSQTSRAFSACFARISQIRPAPPALTPPLQLRS